MSRLIGSPRGPYVVDTTKMTIEKEYLVLEV
jgi:hypothetical protein